jgi:hypothetical protein
VPGRSQKMKRSEMIRLIDQCLYDYTDDDFMVLKPSEFVYELLNRIEEAGMLPPCSGYKDKHREDVGYYEWESEDEDGSPRGA